MPTQFTFGAFGILTDDHNRVLLCLRNDINLWNLPGGGVESGEAPWEAVIREVKEETGFDAAVERIIGIYSKPEVDQLVFLYQCKILSGEMQVNSEAREVKYFLQSDIPANTLSKHIERINDYFMKSREVIQKKQFGKSTVEIDKEEKHTASN